MTGIQPFNSGVYGNHDAWAKIMPDAVTMSRYFMASGYRTRGAGKIFHHGKTGNDIPGKPSFQKFFKMLPARWQGKNYNGHTTKPLNRMKFDWGEHSLKMIDLDTVEWCEDVMEKEKNEETPMFLAAGIFKPHLPFYAPPETFEKYSFDETKLPEMKENDLDDVGDIAKNALINFAFL